MKGKLIAALTAATLSLPLLAADKINVPTVDSVKAMLSAKFPATKVDRIEASLIPGLFEVTMGENIAYVTPDGRYFLFGHIYDMEKREDLTAGKKAKIPQPKASFSELPLGDAVKTVRGDGSRKIAVFADPNCPYCKKFEVELEKVDNVTVYTFLTPILSENSKERSAAVWCSADRAAAWRSMMVAGQNVTRPVGDCDFTVFDRTQALASRLKIRGTPSYIVQDGTMGSGATPAAAINALLAKQGS